LLVAISALISSLSLQRIAKWTAELRKPSRQPESGLARSLGIQSAATPVPDVFTKARSPGLPRDLLIGSGPELSGELVMSVQVTNLASISGPGQQLPLYWRSFTYDIYTGHGWSSSDTQEYTYDPNQAIQPSTQPYHVLIQQLVRPVASAVGVIYAAGEPVSVSVATSAAWRSSNDLFGIQTGATGYEAQSLIPLVDEQSLRQAGQAYPEWVMSRYLALPDEVPARVKDLASELTATEPTPYDRARAIEKYLRTYPYTLDVTRPTLSHDLVDFFLFDIKKGYCDYYASAMVVLARAAGIPARLAIGYATGTYNVNSGLFLVTQAEAHSWPELYFPGIGWVPFEPTAGRPAFSQIEQPTPGPIPTQTAPLKPVGHTLSSSGKYLGIAGLALILLAGAGWAIGDKVILSRLRAPWLAAELYRRLRRYGKLLGMTASPGETPYEFAEHLSQGLHAMAGTANRPTYVDGLVQEIQSITRQVVRLSFRPSRTNQVNKLLPQWRHLRWRLRWMWIFGKWSAFRKRISDWLINSALPIDGGGE
jgi:transglutaminase-like putative cysteine protease